MYYYSKYLKYRQKYIALKYLLLNKQNQDKLEGGAKKQRQRQIQIQIQRQKEKQIAGRTNNDHVIGINFEGGKIINHIKQYEQCIAYANCQIAMDAPYHDVPRIADETVRSSGRSENQFKGYDEEKLKNKLEEILNLINTKYSGTRLVIQIARGRSSEPTFIEVIKPILEKIGIIDVVTKYGYRSENYYIPPDDLPFVFLNYGMFAELSDNIPIEVGEICNPIITYDIINYTPDTGFKFENMKSFEKDNKNILNKFSYIKKLTLFGIADDMKFITPDIYNKKHVLRMIDSI
jgi:hypothetical protein